MGVSVLVKKENRLLLGRRKNNSAAGFLSTPGGRLEIEETLLECAAREFNEETLATLGPVTIIGWKEHFRYGNHYIMFYAYASSYTGEIQNGIPDKSDDWEWFDFDALTPENCTEPTDILETVRSL